VQIKRYQICSGRHEKNVQGVLAIELNLLGHSLGARPEGLPIIISSASWEVSDEVSDVVVE
jgi:hypothetical protein